MKNIVYICLTTILAAGLFLTGCDELERGTPVSEDDSIPAPVSNVQIENIPGGAVISYVLPDSENLLYVEAEYSIREGVKHTIKSSYYKNSITLEGFSDTLNYEVGLYAVSMGGKKSEPVKVNIKPLIPPVISIFKSMSLQPTFGGALIRFQNESEANIKIYVITTDSIGDYYTADINYTKTKGGSFTVRGFADVPRKFGVFVMDRWNNYSDTLVREFTPYFEEEMDKNKFKEVRLPTDTWQKRYAASAGVPAIWDNNLAWSGNTGNFQSILPSPFPQWFTFEIGVTAQISRLKYWMKAAAYNSGNQKVFEIWGSNDPNPDGSWDSWTLIGHFETPKPSGLPLGSVTQEDTEFCQAGIDFEFSSDIPAVRYIRWKTLEVYNPTVGNSWIAEISLFGKVIE
jgi:hypothetical protein